MADVAATKAALAALMESLFPASDPERQRLAALAPEAAMPADATSPLKRLMGWLRK